MPAPLTLRNARLVGRDAGPDQHTVEIRDGRITAIAPATESDTRGPVESIDLEGRWVLPGLWDHHVHFDQWAIARDRLDLSGAESAAAAAALIGRELASRQATGIEEPGLIIGVAFRDALWGDQPSATLLDQHTGEVPVVLVSGDLHSTWLNHAALRRFGHADHPTGLLREQPAFDVQLAATDVSSQRIDELVAAAASAAAARGVVGIVDFEWPDNAPVWQRRIAGGTTKALRVICSVWPQNLSAAIERGHRAGDSIPDTLGQAVMGPLKIIIDGSLNTRTAYCFDNYPGRIGPEAKGLLTVEPADLRDLLARAKEAGLGAAVHAIGDQANALALDAFEQVRFDAPQRCSIEHVQLIEPRDIARLAQLGIVASVQPEHAVDDRDVADRYWPGRTAHAFAYRSLLDAAIPLAFGSDAPVAPLDPWVTIAAAVHRAGDGRAPWHPEQQVSIGQALRASFRQSLEAGAAADLVVVDRDPLTSTPAQLRTMPVAATMCGAAWTHSTLR